MAAKEQDQEFVEYIVKAFVEKSDKVTSKRTIDERGVLIELNVDPEDMGKIIGKQGQTAKAIRTLLRVVGAKNNARVNLKIIEPEGGRMEAPAEEKKEESKPGSSIEDIEV
jgi:predicted RNA-binding protein YlqC (UPF0109 family)